MKSSDLNKETFETWNKIAGLYNEKFMDISLYNDSYLSFCSKFPSLSPTLLEIGCGPGNITQFIKNQLPTATITAVDYAPAMIELAKENVPSVNFEVLDARAISTIQQAFDGIICGFIIPYLNADECQEFIQNCAEKLTKNGWFYISFVPHSETFTEIKSSPDGNKVEFNYFSIDFIEKELERNSLVIEEIHEVPFPRNNNETEIHRVIIAQKR